MTAAIAWAVNIFKIDKAVKIKYAELTDACTKILSTECLQSAKQLSKTSSKKIMSLPTLQVQRQLHNFWLHKQLH